MTTLPSIPSSESVHLHHFKRRGHDDSSGLSPVGTDDSDEADEYETKAPSGAWRRQLSPCSVFSAASSGRLYAEPAQTLIFLDWDDTIFPCTEIFTTRNYTRRSREWTKHHGTSSFQALFDGFGMFSLLPKKTTVRCTKPHSFISSERC